MEKLHKEKHSSLLQKLVNYGHKIFHNIGSRLPDLPVGVFGHVAASMKDVPVFCESGRNRKACFKMDKATRKWVSVNAIDI
jgi:hypothetical protein